MRLWKKKFYKEVICKACNGTGRFITGKFSTGETARVCDGCNGKGTQTVLEREE